MFHMEHCVFCAPLTRHRQDECGRPCDEHEVKLRDRVGKEHPLKADVGCRNTLFNAVPQSAAEYLPRLLARHSTALADQGFSMRGRRPIAADDLAVLGGHCRSDRYPIALAGVEGDESVRRDARLVVHPVDRTSVATEVFGMGERGRIRGLNPFDRASGVVHLADMQGDRVGYFVLSDKALEFRRECRDGGGMERIAVGLLGLGNRRFGRRTPAGAVW